MVFGSRRATPKQGNFGQFASWWRALWIIECCIERDNVTGMFHTLRLGQFGRAVGTMLEMLEHWLTTLWSSAELTKRMMEWWTLRWKSSSSSSGVTSRGRYSNKMFSICWDSTTCEPLYAILGAKSDGFRTGFRAFSVAMDDRIWQTYVRFAECDFLLVCYIILTRCFHCVRDYCCQSANITFHTSLVFFCWICDHIQDTDPEFYQCNIENATFAYY